MKTRSILFSVFFSATAFAFLTNCSGNKKDEADIESHSGHESRSEAEQTSGATTEEAAEPQFKVGKEFQQQLADVFTSYVELKDAFVDSDSKKVTSEASETAQAVTRVDMKLLSGAAHNDWMNYLVAIRQSLKEIQSTEDIEAQRKSFSSLTDNLYKSIKAFGLGGAEAFYEFCPMAFNNEGGFWLSENEEIRNPYFGDKMLTCGSVQERLK